jgi:NADH-quinone oxidoreductase subunit C
VNSVIELKAKFGDRLDVKEKSHKRVFAAIAPADLREIVEYVFKTQGARMSTITSVDQRAGIELLYHFVYDKEGVILSMRVLSKKPELNMDSIVKIIPGAEWVEREIWEMMGVKFVGNPHLKRLFLPDDWKEGELPYRKKSFESTDEGPVR